MIRIAVLCLLLTGCTGVRQINPGAQVPIYVAPQSVIMARWNDGPAPRGLVAMYDREAKEIWVSEGDRYRQMGWLQNEMNHLADDCGGHWRAAFLTKGRGFNATCDDMPLAAKVDALAYLESVKAGK